MTLKPTYKQGIPRQKDLQHVPPHGPRGTGTITAQQKQTLNTTSGKQTDIVFYTSKTAFSNAWEPAYYAPLQPSTVWAQVASPVTSSQNAKPFLPDCFA